MIYSAIYLLTYYYVVLSKLYLLFKQPDWLIPPEFTTSKKKDPTFQVATTMTVVSAATTSSTEAIAVSTATDAIAISTATETNAAFEPSTTVKETNEVVVHPVKENHQRVGCKQGEFLPSTYCNKVSDDKSKKLNISIIITHKNYINHIIWF